MSPNVIRSVLRAVCLAALIWFSDPAISRAEDIKPATKADAHVQKGELSDRMSDMEDLFKTLRRSIRKADAKAESVATIGKITELLEKSKTLDPAWAAKLPEADRAKFITAYKQDISAVIAQFGEMRKAVEADDTAKSQEIYKEIVKAQDAGHDKYIEEKKK